jgi:hypothetical protein
MRSTAPFAFAAAVFLAALTFDETASAQSPEVNVDCAAAFNDAGALREKHSLKDARARYQLCSLPSCPSFVSLCVSLAEEVAASIPSIVLQAQDAQGRSVTAVTVTMDGTPFATGLYGVAVELDPGKHAFEFRADGFEPVRTEIVVAEGKKNQVETVLLQAVRKASPTPALAPAVSASPPAVRPNADEAPNIDLASPAAGSWSPRRTLAVVAGATGAVGLAIGAVFGLKASSEWSSAKSECKPAACGAGSQAQSDHDSAQGSATVSTVFFVAGGVAAAGGVFLWLTAPVRASTGLRAIPLVTARGAGLAVAGTFL